MSRRGHYGFERRRKDDLRKAKQEAKKQRKAERPESGAGPEIGEVQETGARPDVWEWFSPSRTRTVACAPGTRPANDPPDDWVLLTDVAEESDGEEKV